jgi:hypothetical protein
MDDRLSSEDVPLSPAEQSTDGRVTLGGDAAETGGGPVFTPEDAQVSEEFRRSLRESLRRSEKRQQTEARRRAGFDIQLDRHEAKYVIPAWKIPDIREFVRPFCEPDRYSHGDPPRYTVTTLQLDSPHFSLHYAKSHEALNRFKLRVRTYGRPGKNPVFLEVKRKIRSTIVKSRARVPFERWSEDLVRNKRVTLDFHSYQEETAFLDFIRLVREIDARPVVLVRYEREAYVSKLDHYARVSFDTRLTYQPTESWTSWGEGGRWIPLDTNLVQNKNHNFSGAVLEIKTLSDTPQWMIDLVMNFDLARVGHCKYSNAVWQESFFRGNPVLPSYATDLLLF